MKSHPHPDDNNRGEAAAQSINRTCVAASKPKALGMVENEMSFAHLPSALFGFNKAFQKYHKAKQETGGEQWEVKVGCIILFGAVQAGDAKR
jgi:hypothetical protein